MEKLNLKKSALLVIDVQNDFCSKKGLIKKRKINILGCEKTVKNILKIIEKLKGKIPIVFIKAIYGKKFLTNRVYNRYKKNGLEKLCQPNSWGSKFYKINSKKADKIIVKHRYDAFTNKNLEKWLKNNKIDTLILAGFTSDVCVDSTARSGFMKGFHIIALKDCIASSDNKNKDIQFYKKYYNASIIGSKFLTLTK